MNMKYFFGVLTFVFLFLILFILMHDNTLSVYSTLDKVNLDPLNINIIADEPLIHNVYRPLIYWDGLSNYKSDMIKEIINISDTEYIFHLDEDFRFSNGHRLSSDDILYTFKIANEMKDKTICDCTKYIKKIEKLDDFNVKITIKEKYIFFNKIFTYCYIVPDQWNIKKSVPASGPYMVINNSKDRLMLRKNRYYSNKQGVKKIIIDYKRPETIISDLLNKGKYDIILTKDKIKEIPLK
ncbi:hypothetical protein J7L48_11695, partial [bacterium]|nr:hypothetical protein [bacterium]